MHSPQPSMRAQVCLGLAPPPARPACAVSWHSDCIVIQSMPCLSHNTIYCIAIQFSCSQPLYCNTVFSSSQAAHVTIQWCIAIQFSSLAFSCLQYNNCIAIQFSSLLAASPTSIAIQYQPCNTNFFFSQYNWVVAQIRSAIRKKKFSLFFFHLFQSLEK